MAARDRSVADRTRLPRNRILGALPDAKLARIAPALEPVCRASRELAFDVDVPISHAYFAEDCVISIVGILTNGSAVETATVGEKGHSFAGDAVPPSTDEETTARIDTLR